MLYIFSKYNLSSPILPLSPISPVQGSGATYLFQYFTTVMFSSLSVSSHIFQFHLILLNPPYESVRHACRTTLDQSSSRRENRSGHHRADRKGHFSQINRPMSTLVSFSLLKMMRESIHPHIQDANAQRTWSCSVGGG